MPLQHPSRTEGFLRLAPALTAAALALLAAACSVSPTQSPAGPAPAAASGTSTPREAAPAAARGAAGTPAAAPAPSGAATARDYRRDAARHLYAQHADRIYRGRMPPMLEAVGVLQVELDAGGQVRRIDWMRAPRHVPQVMADIERMVRAAAPYPAPARLGRVTYTDTWLWHKSGRFQLDTLTEGQD